MFLSRHFHTAYKISIHFEDLDIALFVSDHVHVSYFAQLMIEMFDIRHRLVKGRSFQKHFLPATRYKRLALFIITFLERKVWFRLFAEFEKEHSKNFFMPPTTVAFVHARMKTNRLRLHICQMSMQNRRSIYMWILTYSSFCLPTAQPDFLVSINFILGKVVVPFTWGF